MNGPDLLPIVERGDPILRRLAEPVGFADLRTSELQRLIAAMRATMEAAPGVGLAAPQVAARRRRAEPGASPGCGADLPVTNRL
jgi:peptide deformylase